MLTVVIRLFLKYRIELVLNLIISIVFLVAFKLTNNQAPMIQFSEIKNKLDYEGIEMKGL